MWWFIKNMFYIIFQFINNNFWKILTVYLVVGCAFEGNILATLGWLYAFLCELYHTTDTKTDNGNKE